MSIAPDLWNLMEILYAADAQIVDNSNSVKQTVLV